MGLFGGRRNTVERFNGIRTNSSILGVPIAILLGTNRKSAALLWYGDFTSNKAKQPSGGGGKGLSKGGSQYVYTASIIAALGYGVVTKLKNVWDSNGRFVVKTATESFAVPGGGGTYTPVNASIYAHDHGVARLDSYSVGPFTDYGSPGPVTLSGTQNTPMTPVGSSPGAGQYVVNPVTGVYTFSAADAGKTVSISYGFYRYEIISEEITVVPFSGPFTVTVDNSTNYLSDQGVVYYPSGTALTKVGSSPAVGQYSQSGAVYTFNAGDTGQGIVISYTYKDPNTNTNAPSTLNLTLVGGTLGQAAQSYMTGRHPNQALGYSQIAYIFSSGLYLGYTPELPNYNYEIVANSVFGAGFLDCNPADCITALLTDTGFGLGFPGSYLGSLTAARNCWTANSFFISAFIENQSACASILAQWLEAGMVAAFWSEAQLKFVPYSDTTAVANGVIYSPSTTPIANITDDQFLTSGAEDPVKIERSAWQDAFNRVGVSYSARVNDYNPEVIYEQDDASILRFGLRVADVQQYDFITTLAAAQYAASMRLQRNVYIRNTYSFKLPDRFSWLEPMDVITINDANLGLVATPVRIQKVEDDPENGLDITAEDFIWGTAQPAFNPKSTNNPFVPDLGQQDPGNTNALIFEAPDRLGLYKGNILYGFVNGSNPNWGGCNVWVSIDGTNYELLTKVTSPARLGTLTQTLAAYTPANPDNVNTLQVKLNVAGATLPAATAAQATNNTTLCAIVNTSTGLLELLSYQNSSLVGAELYNLTTLYRGVYGAPGGTAHSIGEIFARLDQASFQHEYDPTFYGDTISFKFTSFNLLGNQEQSLASVTAYSVTIAGTYRGAVDLLTGTAGPQFSASALVVENANFEASAALPPIGWTLYQAGQTLAFDTTTQFSGKQSLKITSGTLQAGVASARKFACRPGDVFRISGQVKLVSGTGPARIAFTFRDGNGTGLIEAFAESASGSWTFVSGSAIAPAGTVYAQVYCYMRAASSVGEFDEIHIARMQTSFEVTPINTSGHATAGAGVLSQAGVTGTINVAASTVQFGDGTVSYSAGSVSPGLGTWFVYADDPGFAGGAVTYHASATESDVYAANGRIYFGKITLTGGGGGASSSPPGSGGGRLALN